MKIFGVESDTNLLIHFLYFLINFSLCSVCRGGGGGAVGTTFELTKIIPCLKREYFELSLEAMNHRSRVKQNS